LFWGNRVGKTEWGAQEVAKMVLGQHPFMKPGEVWSFSPSFDEQKDTTQEKLLNYLPAHRIRDRIWLRKGILKEITLDTGAKITFKSYEQGREKAQGAGKALIWFDEEPPKDIFEECFVRQKAGVRLRIIMTMTPIKGMTWVYDDIYLKTDSPDIFVSKAGWKDNPFLSDEQIRIMSQHLSPQVLKVRRDGEFSRMVGLVCSWFDRTKHLVDIKDLPGGDTYFVIDFGFNAPTAGLWIRIDRSFNWWVFDGFYRRGLTTPDIAKIIKQKEAGIEGRIRRIGDSAQAADIKELNDAGISMSGVKKIPGTSQENWDEYRARLLEKQGRIQESTGLPKLFISKHLIEYDDDGEAFNFLVKEIENLLWEESKRSDGTVEPKSLWGKQAKHGIDAISYLAAEIDEPNEKMSPQP
jgi:phage terminase large subunit-like protein